MSGAFEQILELVAEGRLTADEAAPLLDALEGPSDRGPETSGGRPGARPTGDDGGATAVRIEVSEAGRRVMNLRVPLGLGRAALDRIPGLSEATSERIREAITAGIKGSILDVDDGDGDRVRVVIE
jgi:hypothetical protein